jgi:serine/threonine-protein kinase HipA
VFLEGRFAGLLERDANGKMSFRYDGTYPAAATPLSPALPVGGGRFTHDSVAPFVTGLLPDNEQVLERWASMFGVRSGNVFALLANVGMDCAGAVQFVPEDRLGELDDADLEPLSDAQVAQMLRELRTNPYTWQQPSGARGGHFSLAGAQSKFALHRTADGWARPYGRVPSTHIFKPSILGIRDHDLNEHLCLSAAAHLGLVAARSEVVAFGDERAVVVERYDRRRAADGTVERVHQVDMCQARGVPPDRKYHRDGGPGPIDIVDTLRNTFTGEPDVERFVRALVFNWVIGGTDAHAKNYGLLLAGTDARLTPLYDVATATVLEDWNWHKWELAMRIHREGRVKYLAEQHWRRFTAAIGLPYEIIVDATHLYANGIEDALSDTGRTLPGASQPYVQFLVEQVTAQADTALRVV